MVGLIVPVLRVLQVMAPLVVQMPGVLQAMLLVLGAAMGEDSGKRNSIEVVVLPVLRIARVMHRVMVLLVMPMVRVFESMHRAMVPLLTPMVIAGVAMVYGVAGDAGGDSAAVDVPGDGEAGNADGEGAVGDAPGDGEAYDAGGGGAAGDATADGAAGDGNGGGVGGDGMVHA